MTALETFLDMGGYAVYVWSAYGLTFLVLVVNVIFPLKKKKRVLQRLIKRQSQS